MVILVISLSFVSCNQVDKLYEKYDLDQSSFLEFNEHQSLFLDQEKNFQKCVPAVSRILGKNLRFKAYLALVDGDLDKVSNIRAILVIIRKNYESIKTSKKQMKEALKKMKKLCDQNDQLANDFR